MLIYGNLLVVSKKQIENLFHKNTFLRDIEV